MSEAEQASRSKQVTNPGMFEPGDPGELRELVRKTERYAICVLGPDLIEVLDERFLLDGLLAWPELWPPDEDCGLSDFEDLLRQRSLGPTLNEADKDLLIWLGTNAEVTPDDEVAARHGRLCEDSAVFKGSMTEAAQFLRSVLAGRLRPIACNTDRPC
jgi:hypothetical protein